jgi:hypothetical protein
MYGQYGRELRKYDALLSILLPQCRAGIVLILPVQHLLPSILAQRFIDVTASLHVQLKQ